VATLVDHFEHAKPSRRAIRYSLRSLLIVTTIFCFWLGLVAYRAHEQGAAVATLRNLGVRSIKYDPRPGSGWEPLWLREAVGDGFFANVTEVELYDEVTSEKLPKIVTQLRRLPKLNSVNLWDAKITDDDLALLRPLTQIQQVFLYFQRQPVTGEGLQHLTSMSNIRQLTLLGTSVSPRASESFSNFENLESLHISGPAARDEGLEELASCPRLQNLTLDSCNSSTQGLRAVARIQSLKSLRFHNSEVAPNSLPDKMPPLPEPSRDPHWQLQPFMLAGLNRDVGGSFKKLEAWFHTYRPDVNLSWGFSGN